MQALNLICSCRLDFYFLLISSEYMKMVFLSEVCVPVTQAQYRKEQSVTREEIFCTHYLQFF